MLGRSGESTSIRSQLNKARRDGRAMRALELYERIEKQEPNEPRWSHRKGDLLQRMGRRADAVLAYQRAVELYSEKGFTARAAATERLITAIDESRREASPEEHGEKMLRAKPTSPGSPDERSRFPS